MFHLGQIVITPGASAALANATQTGLYFIARHTIGDWGDLPADDIKMNDEAVIQGERILSSYKTRLNETIWIITEADRSVTTLLLPTEY